MSVGSWSEFATTDSTAFGNDPVRMFAFNHYKPECLVKAGGRPDGTMDFWQFHCYPNPQNRLAWTEGAPWSGFSAEDYQLDLPLVIGEFPTEEMNLDLFGLPLPNADTTENLVGMLFST